jgi:hypothetical protein
LIEYGPHPVRQLAERGNSLSQVVRPFLSVILKRHRSVVSLLMILPFVPRVALATDVVESGTGAQPAIQHDAASAKPRPVPASSPAKSTSATAALPSSSPITLSAQPKTAPGDAKDGQWVYTQQYGWIWLRYAREFTYITPEGYAYSYAYYPGNGWCWLYSPWVYGWGPAPNWGARGRGYFVWYARPWFARPIGPPRPAPRGGIRSGAHWGGGHHGDFRGGMRGHR